MMEALCVVSLKLCVFALCVCVCVRKCILGSMMLVLLTLYLTSSYIRVLLVCIAHLVSHYKPTQLVNFFTRSNWITNFHFVIFAVLSSGQKKVEVGVVSGM